VAIISSAGHTTGGGPRNSAAGRRAGDNPARCSIPPRRQRLAPLHARQFHLADNLEVLSETTMAQSLFGAHRRTDVDLF
jgi:hypothetical protein